MPPAGYFLCRKESNQRRRLGLRAQTRGRAAYGSGDPPSDESRYQGATNSGAISKSGTRFLIEPNPPIAVSQQVQTKPPSVRSFAGTSLLAEGPLRTERLYKLASVRAGEVLRGGGFVRGSA